MINNKILEEVKTKLISTYNPLEIYVFGSYAWGKPDEESDLDLLVVVDDYTKSRHDMLVDGHRALMNLDIGKDILIFTKDEFDQYSQDVTKFCYKIKNKGLLIYAKA